jgi:acetyltransferase-like isoleucine patch superfamily enzyme
MGYKAHFGAGAITSNVKNDNTNVVVKVPLQSIDTGLRKFGAIVGDHVQVGCNSVLNPGTMIGRNTSIYPLSCVRGIIRADMIVKNDGKIMQRLK